MINKQLTGSVTENVAKLSFANVPMQAAERSHNFVVDSSNDFNRRRGVAISITVSISVDQLHALDVSGVADEMSNSRRSPSLMPDSGHRPPLLSEAPQISS